MTSVRRHRHSPADGFTLIELLVALFIIGILLTLVVIRTGGEDERSITDDQANRLRAVILLALERAVLNGREFGLLVRDDGYRVMVLGDRQWHTVADSQPLRVHQFPDWLHSELILEAEPVRLEVDKEKSTDEPQVALLSSGEMTPFELILAADDGYAVRIVGDERGEVSVDAVDPSR